MRTILVNGIVVGEVPRTGDVEKDLELAREFLKARNLLPEQSPVRALLGQALAFATTAHTIWQIFLKSRPSANGLVGGPFAVNSAFSIELYLKALHLLQGTPQRGHRLLTLYDALNDDVRKHLEAGAKRYGPTYLPPEFHPFEFRMFVSELDNVFVEWRYLHENTGRRQINFHPTIFVMKVLHEVSQEMDLAKTPATPLPVAAPIAIPTAAAADEPPFQPRARLMRQPGDGWP